MLPSEYLCNKFLLLTEIYTFYELDKQIWMTNVKLNYVLLADSTRPVTDVVKVQL